MKVGDPQNLQTDPVEKNNPERECDKQQLSEAVNNLDNSAVSDDTHGVNEDSSSQSSQSADIVGIAPEVRKRLETKWEKILGPKYKIIVSKTYIIIMNK